MAKIIFGILILSVSFIAAVLLEPVGAWLFGAVGASCAIWLWTRNYE